MLTSVLTVGTTAVVTGTLAGRLGPDRCGGHMLARRMVNLVSPFCTLAMGVAVPRYVAMAQNDSERRAFLLAGLRTRRRSWPADWRPGHSAAQLGRETPPRQGTGSWPDNRCPLSTSSVTFFGSPALSMIQGHQLARRLSFSRGFSVILGRRRAVFIESAGEPLFHERSLCHAAPTGLVPHPVPIWFGETYADAVLLTRLLLVAAIPHTTYVMLRSIIDPVEHRPVNTINLGIALLGVILASLLALMIGWGAAGLALSTSLGFWLLGALSVCYLRIHFGLIDHRFMPVRLAMVNVVFLLRSLGMAGLLQAQLDGVTLLTFGALVEGMLFLAYCTVMWWLRVWWILEAMKGIFAVAGTSAC